MRKRGARILGPYADGSKNSEKHLVVEIDHYGKRFAKCFTDKQSAADYAEKRRLELQNEPQPDEAPVSLRIDAVYRNGHVKRLREFAVKTDGLSGFETDDSEYIVFLHRADRTSAPVGSTANDVIPEGVPF